MADFKFYITYFDEETELTNDPIGWADFSIKLQFNREDRTLLYSYPQSLIFHGDGHEVLRNARDGVFPSYLSDKEVKILQSKSKYCAVLDFRVEKRCTDEEGYRTVLNGKIFIADVTFNRFKKTAEVEIQDNSFSSLIRNNWNVKMQLNSKRTKEEKIDGQPIPIIDIDMYNPANNFYDDGAFNHPGKRKAFDVKFAIGKLVEFMTDGVLPFRSDWYDSLSDTDESLAIMMGYSLRLGDDITDDNLISPIISFKEIWDFISRFFNLVLYIKDGELRIEEINTVLNTNEVISLNDIRDVDEYFEQQELYSSVKLGTSEFDDKYTFPQGRFVRYSTEEYFLSTGCNIDSVLDLSNGTFITDSNIIERNLLQTVAPGDDEPDGDDEKFFIVQYRIDGIDYKANQGNALDSLDVSPRFYNRTLLNSVVALRYNFYADIVLNLVDLDNEFRASRTTAGPDITITTGSGPFSPFQFDDDYTAPNFDDSNSWGNGTPQGSVVSIADSRYTFNESGTYGVRTEVFYNLNWFLSGDGNYFPGTNQPGKSSISVFLVKYNSAGMEVERISDYRDHYQVFPAYDPPVLDFNFGNLPHNPRSILIESNFTVGLGDYLEVEVIASPLTIDEAPINAIPTTTIGISFPLGSYIETYLTETGGGAYVVGDSEEPLITRFGFKKAISDLEIIEFQNNPERAIIGTDPMGRFKGFPNDITINLNTGEGEWEIRSKESLLNL